MESGKKRLKKIVKAELIVIQKHAVQLMEHFDTVKIFATRHDGDSNNTHIIMPDAEIH